MRKLCLLLAATAMLAAGLSPAEAASSYKITLNPAPKGKTSFKHSYNDTALDVSKGTHKGRERTTIRGKVSGGKVKGQRVVLYATNTNLAQARRVRLGTATLSSKGYFRKKFSPGRDHGGLYKIEIEKAARGSVAAARKTFYIRVYQFVEMRYFFNAEASTPGLVGRADREKFGKGVYFRKAYYVNGGAQAVFDTAGYNCLQVVFKTGISRASKAGGRFSVVLRSDKDARTLVPTRTMKKNQKHYEPSKKIQRRMSSTRSFVYKVARYSDGDPATVDDQTRLRYILGRPMAMCTYPVKGGTPTTSRWRG